MSEDARVVATTSMDKGELESIRDAFHAGRFETVLQQHEGMTRTLIFERPSGHIGLSIGMMPGDGDVHVSVSEWEREPHHECDRWVWVRKRLEEAKQGAADA